ncbi:Nudix hydrolase 17- mitochondrial, partial [Striga hermonthica]
VFPSVHEPATATVSLKSEPPSRVLGVSLFPEKLRPPENSVSRVSEYQFVRHRSHHRFPITNSHLGPIRRGYRSSFRGSFVQPVLPKFSKTGRHLQRYNQGFRQVVGCIPYRIRKTSRSPLIHGTLIEDVEVLLISSQKSPRMMFPKGGWELDEDIELAASRETLEEAGVIGLLGEKIGEWRFKSKSQEKYHEGSMFPLLVTEELDTWPEKSVRRRVWMKVNEAREACAHSWMKEALELFVCQVAPREEEKTALGLCRLGLCRAEDHLRLSIGPQNADHEDVDSYLIS